MVESYNDKKTAVQEKEAKSQKDKRFSRLVEAAQAGILFKHEVPHHDVAAEAARVRKSRQAREGVRFRLAQKLKAAPPTPYELKHRATFIDTSTDLPRGWLSKSTVHEAH